MTVYTRRIIMIVTAADQETANDIAVNIDPDSGGQFTFSVPLSATGNDPATHYACSTLIKPATLTQVEAVKLQQFPTGVIYRGEHDLDDEEGVTRYTFEDAIAHAGLQRIVG